MSDPPKMLISALIISSIILVLAVVIILMFYIHNRKAPVARHRPAVIELIVQFFSQGCQSREAEEMDLEQGGKQGSVKQGPIEMQYGEGRQMQMPVVDQEVQDMSRVVDMWEFEGRYVVTR
jgi:hypothetical protein